MESLSINLSSRRKPEKREELERRDCDSVCAGREEERGTVEMSILGNLIESEKELLKKAEQNNGEIHIFKTDQTGEVIKIGSEGFRDEKDPSVRVRYLEALEKLKERGLVRHEGGPLFCLSGSGFEEARKLSRPDLQEE